MGDIIVEKDNTFFMKQFRQINKDLNPIILESIKKNNFGDNVVLFYFAGLIKETLKEINNRELKEAVLRFMFDE